MKNKFTYLGVFVLTAFNTFAQLSNSPSQSISNEPIEVKRKCATPILDESFESWIADKIQKQQQFANEKKAAVVYNIPVIFHIIHTGQAVGTGANIPAARITQQINTLNADYRKLNSDLSTYLTQPAFVAIAADCEINFCLANVSPTGAVLTEPGIERFTVASKGWTTSPPYTASSTYLENTVKAGSIWDPTKYFNVWVTQLNGGVLGYAQFPTVTAGTTPIGDMAGFGASATTDGVVVDYKYIGLSGTTGGVYNLGRTLTHESGHWLGLRHIWGDDGTACSGSDYAADTPNQAGENYTCPTTNGSVRTDACSPSSPGVLYQNYMDYSDDRCMVMFTTNQKARIQAVMANCVRRSSLNTSTVCSVPTGINETSSISEVELFPNPSNGELNVMVSLVTNDDYSITVINTLGQVIKQLHYNNSNGGKSTLDLSSNSQGVYFVTVRTKSGSKTKRLIIQ